MTTPRLEPDDLDIDTDALYEEWEETHLNPARNEIAEALADKLIDTYSVNEAAADDLIAERESILTHFRDIIASLTSESVEAIADDQLDDWRDANEYHGAIPASVDYISGSSTEDDHWTD